MCDDAEQTMAWAAHQVLAPRAYATARANITPAPLNPNLRSQSCGDLLLCASWLPSSLRGRLSVASLRSFSFCSTQIQHGWTGYSLW